MMRRSGRDLNEQELDELERITAELRCLERRCRKSSFSEVSYMLGLAEESARQTLMEYGEANIEQSNLSMEADHASARVIRFPSHG